MTRFITVAILLLPFAAAPGLGDDKPADASTDGTWMAVTAEFAGEPFPEAITKMIKLVLEKDKYTVEIGDRKDEGTVTRDLKSSPKTMDVKGTKGPNEGKTFLAIYEIKGDEMKVCYDLSGESRPTEFATKKDTKLYLVTYKKEKK